MPYEARGLVEVIKTIPDDKTPGHILVHIQDSTMEGQVISIHRDLVRPFFSRHATSEVGLDVLSKQIDDLRECGMIAVEFAGLVYKQNVLREQAKEALLKMKKLLNNGPIDEANTKLIERHAPKFEGAISGRRLHSRIPED